MSTVYAPATGPFEVALCDVCDTRPGANLAIVSGIETFMCDPCLNRGEEAEEETFLELQQKANRALNLANSAADERRRLERMLLQAREKEAVACDEALRAAKALRDYYL